MAVIAPAPTAAQAKAKTPRARQPTNGHRIAIERIAPEIDSGRFPVKRVVGEVFSVSADIFRDGHDRLRAVLLTCRDGDTNWRGVPMRLVDNDRWSATLTLTDPGRYVYTLEAWTDAFASWRDHLAKKSQAGQPTADEIAVGVALLTEAVRTANGAGRTIIESALASAQRGATSALELLLAPDLETAMAECGPRCHLTRLEPARPLVVDRPQARFAAWYEMFPRSQGTEPGESATFGDCAARLDDIAAMGFDTIYLPPIHPIGLTNRKGRNNSLGGTVADPGSPYAIGSTVGGHDAVEPQLGTLDDFRAFVDACHERGMEIALDFAVQCSLDHPWIKEHPDWFEFRSDGSIRHAENPPKKYEDIVNLNFDAADWRGIWRALREVLRFWIAQGVRIFRVDNPHTKPYPFWEWLIRDIQATHPDVIFLAEAFTRPKPMRYLAKLGFTQSYTYFTWRNDKAELADYFVELTCGETREYFRPHLFTNTPDILPRFLQTGGPPAFRIRAALAATLGGLWGIYNGFELCENRALPDSEEYADSEKYEYKVWNWNRPGNIKRFIAELNRIRRDNAAFSDWLNLEFLPAENPHVLFYARVPSNPRETVFIAISLNPLGDEAATIELPLERLGISEDSAFAIRNLLTDEVLHWTGPRQSVWIGPRVPIFVFKLTEAVDA
ncbi:MAG: alpha-1,4-glucan--maltose-1-phosphate maltosyltransferase [Alphaproteobacteria bacterium]|nr:alpha-1,4-glucan--maltose-1-phosphate maltosyltransferase [Alphaproteobacteria bacterium]